MLTIKNTWLRLSAIVLSVLLLIGCINPVAVAEDDNRVRVLLTRLGSRTSISMELFGGYVVNGISLTDGAKVNIKLSGGKISVSTNGSTLSTASTVTVCRTGSGVNNGIRFTSPSLTNIYCGNLILKSSGGYIQPILDIDVETYLYGVVPYEIGNGSPLEAQKAQAVAARTFAMRAKKTTGDYDLYDNANSQVFKGYAVSYQNAKQAVDETCGVVLKTVGGNYAQCYYTASNGGQTESTKNAWGGEVSYLTVKDDPYDYESTSAKVKSVTINKDGNSITPSMRNTILSAASSQLASAGMSGASISSVNSAVLSAPRYADPSRLYTKLTLNVTFHSASKAANLDIMLKTYDSLQNTYSLSINSGNNEVVWIRETNDAYILEFKRYGHGIGMSQCGAMVMAGNYQMTYAQILDFYYHGTILTVLPYASTIISKPQEIIVTPGGKETGNVAVTTYPTMRYGDKNDGVKQLQAKLKNLGYFNNDITGNFYSATEAAVRAFQRANGLTEDGIAGPKVQAKLFGSTSSVVVVTPTEQKPTVVQPVNTSGMTMKYGDKGSDVVDLQNKLKKLGYFNEVSTGNYYSVTEGAVKAFQKDYGYSADGIATQELIDKINDVVNKQIDTKTDPVYESKKAVVNIGNSSSYLNVRAQASTNSAVVTTLKYGTEVEMVSDDGEWMSIKYNGVKGYVASRYMKIQTSSTSVPESNDNKYAIVATESDSYLNIRSAADTSSYKLGQLNCGTRVTVISESGDWTKISYNGITGFVFNAYLRKD